MAARNDYSGITLGRITLSAQVAGKPGYWQGTCSCGNTVEKRLDNLKRPGNHSCGRCRQPSAITPAEVLAQLKKVERELAIVHKALLRYSWWHRAKAATRGN